MSIFKRRRFPVEIILVCVRWYCKYGITYRDLAEMMQERGVGVDASTIFRWVQRYAHELERRVRWYQGYRSGSWRVDETYVRVGGQWKYLFRAIDKHGELIDFMLLDRSYPKAIRRLQREGTLSQKIKHRTSKYLNNIIEADHGGIKRVIRPTRGFQTMRTAYATIKGFEIMRMIRRRHCILCKPNVEGEIQFVNKLFDVAA
jgi:transposase-like protein